MIDGLRQNRAVRLAISVLAAFLLACVDQAAAECALSAVAVLPITETASPFVINASINGFMANLVLETGSFRTTLDKAAAPALGVILHETDDTTYGVLGGIQHTWRGEARRMQIGGMRADSWPIRGLDLWPAGSRRGRDGQMGMDLMAAYDIDLDVAGKHVIVYKADGHCATPTVALGPTLYAAPLEQIYQDRQADVDVVIDGKHFRAMLDSGAGHTVMYRKAAQRLGIDLEKLSAPGHATIIASGGFETAYFTRTFDSLQIGDLELRNMTVRILEKRDSGIDRQHVGSLLVEDSTQSSGQDMILGADFMHMVHLWISHSSQTLIMQYPPQPSTLPR